MKKIFTTLLVLSAAIIALAVTHLWVYQSDGTYTGFDVTTVDSVSLVPPAVTAVSPQSKNLTSEGGQFTITLQSNKAWTATVSNPNRLSISQASGVGNSLITCTAQPNNGSTSYTESVTFLFEGGKTKDVFVTVEANTPFMALLNASAYIVYDLPSLAFDRIADRVVLDLRPNDEYRMMWDWNVPSVFQANEPDAFFGETTWMKVTADNGWGGAGYAFYKGATPPQYDALVDSCLNAYNDALKGHESEWEFVMVARNSGPNSQSCATMYGFGNSQTEFYLNQLDEIPDDGQWHVYTVNLAELGSFDLALENNSVTYFSKTAVGGPCEVCAAFLKSTSVGGETLFATPGTQTVGYQGGQLQLEVRSNTSWTVSSNRSWLRIAAASGDGDRTVGMTVSENLTVNRDTAIVTIATASGLNATQIKVIREGSLLAYLSQEEYIVYEMSSATYEAIADRVLLDLRPNDEYLVLWDWNPTSLFVANEPDAFMGGTDWYKMASNSWYGAGNAIYGGYGYSSEAVAAATAYNDAVKGHESEWDFVMVARNSKDATVSIYGFGGNGAQIQIGESIGIPSDGEWHVYSVNCAQFDSFDLLYENETANVFSRSGGSSCEICAAFLMRNTGASNKLIVAPAIEKMDGEGGDFLMNVRTNTAWSASCNKQWVTLSQSRGEGNSIVEVSVAPNDGLVKDTALIEVSSADGEAKIMKVVREGNFWSTLNAQSLIVYKMDDATFNRVSNNVAVDLRPNYEYIMLYDWEGQGLQATSEPNPFGGRTDWYSFNSGNNGWAGGGTALYWDEEDPRYDNDITNTFNACVTALHGRESQWELVMILKNTGVPRVEVQLTGFGEGVQIFKFESDNSSNTHVMDVPNDNQWHEYAISCSELGSYDFPIDGQSHPIFCETVGNEGSIMVCAAFLRKR